MFALPRKDCSSGTLVGASASLIAFNLSFVGEIPSAEIVVPRYTTWSSIKWYLNTRARAILFCARALFIHLIDVCI